MESDMKNLIRGSVATLVGAAALLAAYASLSGPPAAGGAGPTAARATVPAPEPHSSATGLAPLANSAQAAASEGSKDFGLLAAAPDCDFCLYAVGAETAGSFVAEGDDDLWRLADDEGSASALASFGEWTAAPALAGLEPNAAIAAPAPEISTAAMFALGAIILTARTRRKAWAAWKTAWMSPALAEPL